MALFGLFRPPDVVKLEASRDAGGLAKVAQSARDWVMRRDALYALQRLEAAELPALLQQVLRRDEYWKNREIAADLLAALGDEGAIEPMIAATRDDFTDVRWMAVRALDRLVARVQPGLPAPNVVRALVRSLEDSAWWVRQSAAQALERVAIPEHYDGLEVALKPLHRTLQDEVRAVRQAALNVLIRLNAPPTIESLVLALTDVAWSVRLSSAEALEALGWEPSREQEIDYWIARGEPGRAVPRGLEAVPALVRMLDDQYPPLVADVVDALARLGNTAVPALLEQGLHHRDWWAREAAARVLARVRAPQSVIPLIRALSDRSYSVRETCTRALAALGDPRALPYLQALASHDPHRLVRAAASEALRSLPAPR
ncbi:MAG: HEAT repeat domain-containing protein [Anaerolineae bacterium]|nr:HEAT repeat domain-containing protein [Chloroflexota bacterium]